MITVGGELTLDMLDLTFNPSSNFYEAPLQLKAMAVSWSSTISDANACPRAIS